MPLLLAILVAHGGAVRTQDRVAAASLALLHIGEPGKLALGKLCLPFHPGNVGRVSDVRVDDAEPRNCAELVAAVHLAVAAGHPDDGGRLHAGEEAPAGNQDPGRILQESFTTWLVL